MLTQQMRVDVLAPLSGAVVPIEAVPDPAFSEKMVGDGLSIDPRSNLVLSPFDGRVIELQPSRHAVVIEGPSGLKIMVHVGIDTVMLKGEGFDAFVEKGDAVRAGQPLLRFDLAHVAAHAASVLTEVVVLNGEQVSSMEKMSGAVEAGKSVLMTLHLTPRMEDGSVPEPESESDGAWLNSRLVILRNPAGLHARPAAILASEARRYSAQIDLSCGVLNADAKSVVELLALATRQGDLVRLSACGADAAHAVEALERLLRDGCGERLDQAAVLAVCVDAQEPASALTASPAADAFAGVAAAPGVAVGQIVQWRSAELEFAETGGAFDEECFRLFTALRLATEQIQALSSGDPALGTSGAEIMRAHLALLDDPALLDIALTHLRAGASAPGAWHRAYESVAGRLADHPSPLQRDRASDVRDVGMRVMSLLNGVRRMTPVLADRSVVVVDDLTPSDTVSLDRSRVVGLCTVSGGPTSHVAILARSMGIPAICGLNSAALSLGDGVTAVVDGNSGMLRIDPDATLLADVARRAEDAAATRRANAQAAHLKGATRDGHRVEVVANVRDAAEAQDAVASGRRGRRAAAFRISFRGSRRCARRRRAIRRVRRRHGDTWPATKVRCPHARCRWRQTATLPAAAEGKQPVSRTAGHSRESRLPGAFAKPIARDAARGAERGSAHHVPHGLRSG